ncbi:MAG: B12-binding domain-containing radical SAM protein [Candidatus Omnitrophica bacterium]|nr:B12-binding domain-containing radical SAM protein [Candidatus Omnitrophota bacterium]
MNNRVFLLKPPTKEFSSSFPLNLAYLAAVLRKNGYEVKVLDASARYSIVAPSEILGEIRDFKPLFVGVTLTYDFIKEKYYLINMIKRLGYPVVAGGPHVNIVPMEVLGHGVDIVSLGEGEEVVLELAEAFSGKRKLEEVHGLGLRRSDGKFVFTPRRKEIQDLDSVPFPDYTDYKIRDYIGNDNLDMNKTFFDVFTSRGCPYRCTYCSASRTWDGGQRRRSARNVFEEMMMLHEKYGAKHIAFMDNEPLVDKKRIYELCDLLENSKVKILISTRARVDNVDDKLLKRMMEVGFYKLAIGVESGDDETLRMVKRFYTQEQVLDAMSRLDSIKFPVVHFNNIIGFPWENDKHLNSTLELNRKIPSSLKYFVNVLTPIPMPGTPLYEEYYERFKFKDWWLDSSVYEKLLGGMTKDAPLFYVFMPRLKLDYYRVDFWKYSPTMKKKILELQLSLQKIAYMKNRDFKLLELFFVFLLIKVSVRLFLLSPRLERFLMSPFKHKRMIAYAGKFIFKEQ